MHFVGLILVISVVDFETGKILDFLKNWENSARFSINFRYGLLWNLTLSASHDPRLSRDNYQPFVSSSANKQAQQISFLQDVALCDHYTWSPISTILWPRLCNFVLVLSTITYAKGVITIFCLLQGNLPHIHSTLFGLRCHLILEIRSGPYIK